MSRAFAIRGAAGIVSTALALGAAAPAASAEPVHRTWAGRAAAARTSSVGSATSHSGLRGVGYSPTSQATADPCNPFALTLEICAAGPAGVGYGVPSASSTPSARPTPARVVTHSSGFDWGYGAIGAATLVLVGIGVGGVRAATNNRTRHTATS
jgi:hypothetical protein